MVNDLRQLSLQGDATGSVAVATETATLFVRDPAADSPGGTCILGGLYQYAAFSAARAGDGAEAQRLFQMARPLAERLARDHGTYGVWFGPANLAVNEACALVHLGKPLEAVRRGERVRPEALGAVHRVGIHAVHLAIAYAVSGQHDLALAAIDTGLRLAPELTRHHPYSRQTIQDLLHRCKRADEQVRRVARQMDLLR